MQILILGNGISRLVFEKDIRAFDGPIWGCNRIYLDYGNILSILAGHVDVMDEAKKYRDGNNCKYKIIGSESWMDEEYSCAEKYRKDTGTSLVAEALTRGHDIIVCGFDLGGADVYSPGHEKKNKSTWVQRWRMILQDFGAERVTFWGHDHKPFLLSNSPAISYFRKYKEGKPHIPGDQYDKILKAWPNDYSRIYEMVPCVMLRNKGKREWKLAECEHVILQGEAINMPETLARKYVESYRKDFDILPLADDID